MTYLPPDSSVRGFDPLTSAVLIAGIVAMGLLVVFMMMRGRKRRLENQKPRTEN
jgi:hypothetical protein